MQDAEEIISKTILNNNIIDRLIFSDPISGEKARRESDIPFYEKQMFEIQKRRYNVTNYYKFTEERLKI